MKPVMTRKNLDCGARRANQDERLKRRATTDTKKEKAGGGGYVV